MMIPRAMLAMREPWEKKRGGEKKKKKTGQQDKIPWTPEKYHEQLTQKHEEKCQNRFRETDRVEGAWLWLEGREKCSWVAWEQGCWSKHPVWCSSF